MQKYRTMKINHQSIYHITEVIHIEKNIRVCKQFINSKIINDSEKIKNVKISRQLNKLANKIYH